MSHNSVVRKNIQGEKIRFRPFLMVSDMRVTRLSANLVVMALQGNVQSLGKRLQISTMQT